MKILIHQNSRLPLRVISFPQEEVKLESTICTDALWELAKRFPEEIIGWCEEEFEDNLVHENWERIFHHDLIMANYALKTTFLPASIGYVDQLPFVNINRNVLYPTWLMSSDTGGIMGSVLLQFQNHFGRITNLGYLLNSVAKIGQQNGLFCYSDPTFVDNSVPFKPVAQASDRELFSFVFQHYTNFWTSALLVSMWKYKNKLPLREFLYAFFIEKKIGVEVDLSLFRPPPVHFSSDSIDVIIPTLGRPEGVLEIVKSLKEQTLLPKKVIIVEQNPNPNSISQLSELNSGEWPFTIVHHFIHQAGVCNARNLAMKEVSSNWTFLCDDDNKFGPDLLLLALKEMKRFGASALNTAYNQKREEKIYENVKQWGAFGAGNAILNSKAVSNIAFDESLEFGYGEDNDFGMQLRGKGIDIIYHPEIKILHLKAPIGGFRQKIIKKWEVDGAKILPKPSPTLMVYALKHFTPEQLKGYKISLFFKFYSHQIVKNPLKYYRLFNKRWNLSEKWAIKIMEETKK